MYKRIRNLKNSCGDTRILKLINESSIIQISSEVSDVSVSIKTENNEQYISCVKFVCGPNIDLGSYINLPDYGRCKIIGIYPSFHDNPNEYLLEILKIHDKGKRRKK
jgi:uncharacterized membrane protein